MNVVSLRHTDTQNIPQNIFSDCSLLLIAETAESKTVNKGGLPYAHCLLTY